MRHSRSALFLLACALAGAGCREDERVRVRSVQFTGVTAVDVDVLRGVLATRQDAALPLLGVRLPWSRSKSAFDRSRFDADLQRIQAFYADRGYPDARVASFDVRLNSRENAVDVTLRISEGAPVRVAALNLVGFEVLPPQHLDNVRRKLPLALGAPRDRQAVAAAQEAVLNELRDHGYPYAKVLVVENDGADGKSASITLTAEPDVLARFGAIEITGSHSVSAAVVRRQLTIAPGDLYRRSLVQDSQRRLYAMELFQFVNIEVLDPDTRSPEARMRVTVAESRHQRVNGGVGYGTEEKARVEGEYRHVNFLGGARAFGARARWSSLDRGVRLDFNQPYVFMPGLSLGADGQRWYTFTPAYKSVVTGGRLALVHKHSARFSWTASVARERNVSSIADGVLGDPELYNDLIALGLDPTTGKQEGTLGAVALDVQRSTTDTILNPRSGYQTALHVEDAGTLLPGTFHYRAVSVDARQFLPVGPRLVAAYRVQVGSIHGAGGDLTRVPFSKKYFLGGATSLRGWGRYEVSPLSRSGLPIGGDALLAMNAEIRAALRGRAGGVLFMDAGNVWVDRTTLDLRDLRYDVGAGLRYQTPVGPIRFDVGYQINPIDALLVNRGPQPRRWRMHFSIGQAF